MEASPAVGATTLLYSTASSSITILRCLRLVVKMIEGTFPHSSLSLSLGRAVEGFVLLSYYWCISECSPRPALLTQRELIDQHVLVLCYT